VRLVGFTIEIYHDAWSHGHQICPGEFYHAHACSAKPHSYQVHYCFKYKFSHYTYSSCNNYSI